MCPNCFTELIYSFKTYQDFDAFEKKLKEKIDKGELLIIESPEKPSLSYDAETMLKCTHCKMVWQLSTPDNAWRGYFLPETQAINYRKELVNKEKKSKNGCLIILILILIVLIWKFLF